MSFNICQNCGKPWGCVNKTFYRCDCEGVAMTDKNTPARETTPRCPRCGSDDPSAKKSACKMFPNWWHDAPAPTPEPPREYYGHCPKCGELLGFGHLPEKCAGTPETPSGPRWDSAREIDGHKYVLLGEVQAKYGFRKGETSSAPQCTHKSPSCPAPSIDNPNKFCPVHDAGETPSALSAAEFEKQAKDLAVICEKLRPGTGGAIEMFVKMAYEAGAATLREKLATAEAERDYLRREIEVLWKPTRYAAEAERDKLKIEVTQWIDWHTEMKGKFLAAERTVAHLGNATSALLKRAEAAEAELARMREDLEWIAKAGERENQLLRSNGFKFETRLDKPDNERTPAEMWEKLAFSIHTDIWEIAQRAEAALREGGSQEKT